MLSDIIEQQLVVKNLLGTYVHIASPLVVHIPVESIDHGPCFTYHIYLHMYLPYLTYLPTVQASSYRWLHTS